MYISAQDAAANWGVSLRQVQRLLAANRVPGATRLGRTWMIPAASEKPLDPRREQRPKTDTLCADLADLLAIISMPVPSDNPDAVMTASQSKRIQLIHEGALAYARGDFARTIRCFRQHEGDDAAMLCACSLAITAAISANDHPFYLDIEGYLKDMIRANTGNSVAAFAELSLATAYLGAMAPNMVPDWLKAGDFSALPPQALPDAANKRAKYFQCIGDYQSMLTVAQTALAFLSPAQGISFPETYLRLLCAVACYALRDEQGATCWLRSAMRLNLPHGFITPFAETLPLFGGLAEQLLDREFPACAVAVTAQWKKTFHNWLLFHNQFTKDNITLILSLRDYEMALLVARGTPFAQIAKQYNISVGRLNNIMWTIYEKLYITGKKELAQYVL